MKLLTQLDKSIKHTKKVVVALSGGLDSTVLTHYLVKKLGKENVHAISFFYNQRHGIELLLARKTASNLGISLREVDISFIGNLIGTFSSLVQTGLNNVDYSSKDAQDYVPNRNMILLSILTSYAESNNIDSIALGYQKIDQYWDSSEKFYNSMQKVLTLNTKFPINFIAPFVKINKSDVILIANELGVNLKTTWSCYNPQKVKSKYFPCNTCKSCIKRQVAFDAVKVYDPTLTGVRL